jgi:hypothetical protein
MSTSIYDDAVADAKQLREIAEQNAKNAIIEAVTPRIRSFIEDQLLERSSDDTLSDGDSDFVNEEITIRSGINVSEDEVELDESALLAMVKLISKSDNRTAVRESVGEFDTDSLENLASATSKLNNALGSLAPSEINNYVQETERQTMSNSDDTLYEIDLNELGSLVSEAAEEDQEAVSPQDEGLEDIDGLELEGDHGDDDGMGELDDLQLEQILKMLGEDKIQIDLGDEVELPDDLQLIATLLSDEEDEDLEGDELEAAGEMDVDVEEEDEETIEMEDLDEVIEVDANILKSELMRLRRSLREAKELTKVKGIKNDMAHSWGGSGHANVGVKGAYGGKSGGKTGVAGSYGGGKESGDPLKVTLNKLSETVKNERRKNRSLTNKLVEYRSAVETLREQLTDLNLFNAKLLYVNKLLQNKDITSSQKRNVVESIDAAKSLREVKLVYRTLIESSASNKGSINESSARRVLGSSSRPTARASSQAAAGEVDRWALLAGLNNK